MVTPDLNRPGAVAAGLRIADSWVNTGANIVPPGEINTAMLLNRQKGPLTELQLAYMDMLQTRQIRGLPIHHKDQRALGMPIPATIGNLPDSSLEDRWRTHRLVRPSYAVKPQAIMEGVLEARNVEFGDRLVLDPMVNTTWSEDFGDLDTVKSRYGYYNMPTHTRRVQMVADLAEYGIRKALAKKGSAHVLDFGPGIYSLEQTVQSKFTPEERSAITFIGIDGSEDMLRYGLAGGYIDRGIQTDISHMGLQDYYDKFPDVDVALFCEFLEHIPHVAAVYNETAVPWLRDNEAFIAGSVPNAMKFVDYIPLLLNMRSPNEVRRSIVDGANDHYSHFTIPVLSEMLTEIWECTDAGITSNAVPLDTGSRVCDLEAGLDYPGLGLNLLFWGEFDKAQSVG